MAANEYWLKRLERDRLLADRSAKQVADRVKRSLRGQYLQTVRHLEGLYAEAQSRGELGRTKLWNYRRWISMEKQLREFADDFRLYQEEEIRKVLDRVFRETIGADVDSFQQDKFMLSYDPRAVIDTAWSGEHFSQRVWKNTNQLALRIRAEAEQVVLGEKSMGRIKRQLMNDFNVTWSDAERLVDTEISYVLNKANLEEYRRRGRKKLTITNLDVNTCDKCKAVEGEVFDIRDAPVLPLHPRCHCSYCVPEEGDRAEITASGANLEEVYARKGVKGYEQAKQFTPKGTKIAAQPIPANMLESKVAEALDAFEKPEVKLEKAEKSNSQAPAEAIITPNAGGGATVELPGSGASEAVPISGRAQSAVARFAGDRRATAKIDMA